MAENVGEVIKFMDEMMDLVQKSQPDGADLEEFIRIVSSMKGTLEMVKVGGWTTESKVELEKATEEMKRFVLRVVFLDGGDDMEVVDNVG